MYNHQKSRFSRCSFKAFKEKRKKLQKTPPERPQETQKLFGFTGGGVVLNCWQFMGQGGDAGAIYLIAEEVDFAAGKSTLCRIYSQSVFLKALQYGPNCLFVIFFRMAVDQDVV